MNSRNAGYVGVLLVTFFALIWMIWSGLTVMLPDNTEERCDCEDVFHVVGHRGLSVKAPENTMPAFQLAAEETGFIELDVAVTADRKLVTLHDDYVDRTTNGHGAVCRMTLEELQGLDAGEWFNHKYAGVHVPTLDQVFGTLGNTSRYLIDIRKREGCGTAADIVQQVASTVTSYGLVPKVSFSIDDQETILLMKQALPQATVLASINVLYTLAPLQTMWDFVDASNADGVSAHFLMPLLKNSMVDEARERKKKVFIFTVDSMYVSKWLECLGVDAIISNNPEKLLLVSRCPVTGAYDLTD